MCQRHLLSSACVACSLPLDPDSASCRHLGSGVVLCRACQRHAISDAADVRTTLPIIRGELRELGLDLRSKVRVRLGAPAELARHDEPSGDGHLLGLTLTTGTGGHRPDHIEILLMGGLPALVFGRVVAHEAMHAWLAQEAVRLPHIEEEGLCELAAHTWLSRRGGRLWLGLRWATERRDDPIYGVGFRRVWTASGAGPVRLRAGRFQITIPSETDQGAAPIERRRSRASSIASSPRDDGGDHTAST